MAVEQTIKKWTGKSSRYWLDFIGNTAKKTAKKIKRGPWKGGLTCEPQLWMPALVKSVWNTMKKKVPPAMDGNISCSRVVSLILTLWTSRIIRAKAYDCRRELKARKRMMRVLVDYHGNLMDCVSDESRDGSYFPSQEWESPYHAKKKGKK